MRALTEEQVRRLIIEIDDYDQNPDYDSVFWEVHGRISKAGEAGKADIAVVAFWKRLRLDTAWVRGLLRTREEDVREVTRTAFAAGDDREALSRLAALDGFKTWGAMATALLCAYDPRRWPVMDRNALVGLHQLGQETNGGSLAYFELVRRLSDQVRGMRPDVTVRDIDKGLFMIGKRVLDSRRRGGS